MKKKRDLLERKPKSEVIRFCRDLERSHGLMWRKARVDKEEYEKRLQTLTDERAAISEELVALRGFCSKLQARLDESQAARKEERQLGVEALRRMSGELQEANRQLAELQKQHKADVENGERLYQRACDEAARLSTTLDQALTDKAKLENELQKLLVVCGRVWVRDLALG